MSSHSSFETSSGDAVKKTNDVKVAEIPLPPTEPRAYILYDNSRPTDLKIRADKIFGQDAFNKWPFKH